MLAYSLLLSAVSVRAGNMSRKQQPMYIYICLSSITEMLEIYWFPRGRVLGIESQTCFPVVVVYGFAIFLLLLFGAPKFATKTREYYD